MSKKTAPAVDYLTFGELEIEVKYKPIKHSYLRVGSTGLIQVTTAPATTAAKLHQLLSKFYDRLLCAKTNQLHQLSQKAQQPHSVSLLGYPLAADNWTDSLMLCQHELTTKGIYLASLDPYLALAPTGVLSNKPSQVALRLIAGELFQALLDLRFSYFAKLGFTKPTVTIRSMKSRWGSYVKSSHRVTLNYYLIHCPLYLIDYVVVHELCHLVEFNHSSRFYELKAKFLPNWSSLRRELTSYSYLLTE